MNAITKSKLDFEDLLIQTDVSDSKIFHSDFEPFTLEDAFEHVFERFYMKAVENLDASKLIFWSEWKIFNYIKYHKARISITPTKIQQTEVSIVRKNLTGYINFRKKTDHSNTTSLSEAKEILLKSFLKLTISFSGSNQIFFTPPKKYRNKVSPIPGVVNSDSLCIYVKADDGQLPSNAESSCISYIKQTVNEFKNISENLNVEYNAKLFTAIRSKKEVLRQRYLTLKKERNISKINLNINLTIAEKEDVICIDNEEFLKNGSKKHWVFLQVIQNKKITPKDYKSKYGKNVKELPGVIADINDKFRNLTHEADLLNCLKLGVNIRPYMIKYGSSEYNIHDIQNRENKVTIELISEKDPSKNCIIEIEDYTLTKNKKRHGTKVLIPVFDIASLKTSLEPDLQLLKNVDTGFGYIINPKLIKTIP